MRTLNVESLRPDSTNEEKMQREIIKSLERNKIHISEIQGAHIAQDRISLLGNYRIITEAGKSAETGVVSGGKR